MTYLFLLLLPLAVFAADPYEISEEELNPESEQILIKKPEKYLRNESMIYDFNTDLGIKDQRQYTGTDRNRLSVSGHLNGNYEALQDMVGADVIYMRRSTRYNQIWWGAQLFQLSTVFDAVTQNPRKGGANSDATLNRPGTTKENIMAFGLGVGYRFKLLLDFWPTEDVFESVDVFVNALQVKDDFINENYQGYGLTTSYGIHKRSSNSFFYGGKFSYNLASVTRKQIAEESKTDRSLSLGWLSFAFELGMFY